MLSNFWQVIDQFDNLIVDLWGVIHDGSDLYPGVLEVLAELHERQKKIIFLSNAPRRSYSVQDLLNKLGIESSSYFSLLTSGEIGFAYLKEKSQREGIKSFFFIGGKRDEHVYAEIGHNPVKNIAEADFIICTGYEFGETEDAKDEILKQAKARNLKMYCFNPDEEIFKLDGSKQFCAGHIAKKYQALGGQVKFFGKPLKETYNLLFNKYQLQPNKTLAIGDNMDTDVIGATNSNISSLLVCTGIPMAVMQIKNSKNIKTSVLEKYLESYNFKPSFISHRFGD